MAKKNNKPENKQHVAPTVFIQWQAGLIAQAVFELAASLETVGAKESTLDQIDVIRRAIVYILNKLTFCETAEKQPWESPAIRKLSVAESKLRDLLKTILERIVCYYRESHRKPLLAETAVDLRRLAESLKHFAGEFKEHIPFETITDEIRGLADDLRNTKDIDEWIKGRAANISIILSAIYSDVALDIEVCGPGHKRSRQKAMLTDDEEKTKHYLSQTMEILRDIAPRRFSKPDSDKLRYFADKLDECPDVSQFLNFWRALKQMKGLATTDDSMSDLAPKKPAEIEQKDEGSKIMITAKTSKENWEAIRNEYDISKKDFGKKIKFVSDLFKRKIIFRDVEHAFVLASQGFSKPALILAGGVVEELLRLYLEHKKIKPKNKRFVDYIKACEDNGLLKRGVFRLTDSIRDFRNLVHLENEETKRHTVSTATAKGAVSSIFTIANDFQ